MSNKLKHAEARLRAIEELSAELIKSRDPNQLIHLILVRAMDLLNCDGGSLYLHRVPDNLDFVIALNHSIAFDFTGFQIPLSRKSIATEVFNNGAVLCYDDVYSLDSSLGISFNQSFDELNGYRTKSMLTVPLATSKGQPIGVLQLSNKKPADLAKWPDRSEEAVIASMPSFDEDDIRLIHSFAAIAASSLENAQLYQQIEHLFDSFVHASMYAIDSRDSGTKGHSERVAKMTRALAEQVSQSTLPAYKDYRYNAIQLKEIFYAAILHDFGKIGVRESTLQKAKKLNSLEMSYIENRAMKFVLAKERKILAHIMDTANQNKDSLNQIELQRFEHDRKQFEQTMQSHVEFIKKLIEPTVLEENAAERLHILRGLKFINLEGNEESLLNDEELKNLSIRRGCLTDDERIEIESHVTKSWEFLVKIPWNQEFKQIPSIAYAHHETLDGKGYPRGLKSEQIPFESKMLSVCDIFDALSASDRSYKKALPIETTLEIMESMAKQNKLDMGLIELFKASKIWEHSGHKYHTVGLEKKEYLA